MVRSRYCYGELLPFVAMIFLQCGLVGLSTLFKAAAADGMSYMVFIVYSCALSGLVILPLAIIFDRRKNLPPFSMNLVGRLFLLGLLGFSTQAFGYKGLEYGSPTLASVLSNLTPAFTFALAIMFRMEKLELKRLSSQAKILGTVISIAGAVVVVLYKGPTVIRTHRRSVSLYQPMSSSQSNWITGGVLFIGEYLALSLWYIAQARAVQKYPAELLIVSLYSFCVALIATPVTFISESKMSAWKISSRMMLYAILYAGLFGSSFAFVILTWGLRLKGPVYVALFAPLSIVIAAFMSVIFLGDSLHLGSIIGAIITSVGFYICMWGKVKEEPVEDFSIRSLESGSMDHVPLLQ